jgi:hypothetical protein
VQAFPQSLKWVNHAITASAGTDPKRREAEDHPNGWWQMQIVRPFTRLNESRI